MNLNVAICDDDIKCINELRILLTALSFELDIDFQVTPFQRGGDLIAYIEKSDHFPFQLLLLDIEMPEENGIEMARTLYHRLPSDSFLVFVSSYPEYMQDSFSVHPFSYLTKPVQKHQLKSLLTDIRVHYQNNHVQIILATRDGLDTAVFAKDVIYIQTIDSKSRNVKIYTHDNEFTYSGYLTDLEQNYPDLMFRLNRTTLINLLHIHYIDGDNVVMNTGTALPISVRGKRQLLKLLQNNPTITR